MLKYQYFVLVRPRWGLAGGCLSMTRMRRKTELPQKICVTCGRPFAWRRKWLRDWGSVRYCSERCRRQRGLGEGVGEVR